MKLVLIDRDGVINEEVPDYIKSPEQLKIYNEAFEALALLKQAGFTCVVITNQSVVGRGIISLGQLNEIHKYMCEQVASNGGEISEVIFCPDAPDNPSNRRKPNAGMLFEALDKYNATSQETSFIGDAITDMEAAYKAGCARYLVMTGKGKTSSQNLPLSLMPVTFCENILDAANKIISLHSSL